MIPIARPQIGDEERQAVLAVLDSGMLAQGKQVQAFEEAFAAYLGVKYAVATSSGTTALHLALLAHDIGPGDQVITSPFSFMATANVALYVGAQPVFADIQPDTFNLDPDQVEAKITPRTKAIMPVDLYGQPAEMDRFVEICERHNLLLIEDACQAHGAEFHGRKVGTFGTGCFSFYPTKNITSGEGGMVTSNDPEIADRLRVLRQHGMRRRYYHERLGYNFRMTDIQAAIGLAQIPKLEKFNQARIANAMYLNQQLDGVIGIPRVRAGVRHVFHQYTIRVTNGRDALREHLREAGIGTEVYYPVPIHKQQSFIDLGYAEESYPISEAACEQVLSLPIHPAVSRADLEQICAAVKRGVLNI